jgi:predicted DNA-binding transcriptional regulator AlpA
MLQKRLRYRDLLALRIVRNRSTLRNWIKTQGFPPGQLTGPNCRTWGEVEIAEYLAARPTAPKPATRAPGAGQIVLFPDDAAQ